MDDASDDDDRALLETDITNNDADIATNQTAIASNATAAATNTANISSLQTAVGQLQTAAPNNHYHNFTGHQHTFSTQNNVSGVNFFTDTTTAPGGTTAVGHSHGVADIPHNHTVTTAHVHPAGAAYGPGGTWSNNTTSGAQ
jgi:hypothetical protein